MNAMGLFHRSLVATTIEGLERSRALVGWRILYFVAESSIHHAWWTSSVRIRYERFERYGVKLARPPDVV